MDVKPRHIAIIMDGNGRWAKKKLLPTKLGHREGAKTLEKIAKYCNDIGLEYLTVYAFSTENWNRNKKEVNELMDLLREFLDKLIRENKDTTIKIKIIGRRTKLSVDILEKIEVLEKLTEKKQGLQLNLAIDYGGRDEILRTIKKICSDIEYNKIDYTKLEENHIEKYLDTKEIVDPDILIRTSGESRLSNFLLWQIAYSEIFYIDELWPDFTKKNIDTILEQFKTRVRRFGVR